VWVSGEHDASTVHELAESLARAIALVDLDVVADLRGGRFMDASTIGVIVRADLYLRSRSRTLTIRAPSPCARRVVAICGVSERVGSGRLSAGHRATDVDR
jgi:anti-anti-sigma factor